jgi:hypothetical protein
MLQQLVLAVSTFLTCFQFGCQAQHIPSKWLPTGGETVQKVSPYVHMPTYPNRMINMIQLHPPSASTSMYQSPATDSNYGAYVRFPMQTEPITANHHHSSVNVLQPLHNNRQSQTMVVRPPIGANYRAYLQANHQGTGQSMAHDQNVHVPSQDILKPSTYTLAPNAAFRAFPPPTYRPPTSASYSASCSVSYEGLRLDCYTISSLYQDKLTQLKQRGMLNSDYANEQFNSCDLEAIGDEPDKGRKRKRRSYAFSILNGNSTQIRRSKAIDSTTNSTLLAMHSHEYPQEYPLMYTVSSARAASQPKVELMQGQADTIGSESADTCFLNAGLTVRTPYHMHNTYGQVRFIVQEEQMRLTQCQPKAICWSVFS